MNAISKDHLIPEIFSVVVLYEDRETRDRVLGVSRQMEGHVGAEVQLKFSWWKFDFLRDLQLAEQAARHSSLADMLIVSAHPGRSLPAAFTEWVETWLPKRSLRESVLVALTGSGPDPTEDSTTQYLRRIASRARMDYLAQPLIGSGAVPGHLTDSARHRSVTNVPLPSDLQIRPPSHWGINE